MAGAKQTFGVSDNQEPARGQVLGEPLYGNRARRGIKIDHDVATEDNMLFPSYGISGLEKINSLKAYAVLQLRLDPATPGPDADPFLKIALQ